MVNFNAKRPNYWKKKKEISNLGTVQYEFTEIVHLDPNYASGVSILEYKCFYTRILGSVLLFI